MKLTFRHVWMSTAMLLALANAAEAHIVAARLGDFYAGAMHPFTDLPDVILWIATGVLAGSLGAQKARWLIPVFPLGLLAGLFVGRTFGAASAGLLDAAMMLVMGLMLAVVPRIPTSLLCTIAFAVAVVRGAANGTEVGPDTDWLLFAAGLACAGYATVALTMALTAVFGRTKSDSSASWRTIAIRAVGGWIAAIGFMMASLALAS